MRTMNEREKGMEAAFAQKEEQAFRLTARRNRLFGTWAAGKLALEPGVASDAYVLSVVAADFDAPGDEDVISKVAGDFAAKGVGFSPDEVRAALARAAIEAQQAAATA
jgi:hypothetical protein